MTFLLQRFIRNNKLFFLTDKLLVAVSGGVDSVVLCQLLHLNKYVFSIAHCNFQLRGNESDADELFVNTFAQSLGVTCFTKRFDTEGYVSEKKISTQMAARELRYQWFEELRQNLDYQYILTAHHASDTIETVLFNFAKSTGLRGLTGIKPKNGVIVRPLLWAKKAEIVAFAEAQNLAFREDASNQSDKYARNYIRHHTVPSLQRINPNFETTAVQNIKRLHETQQLLDFFIEKTKQEITESIDNQLFIHKEKLKTYPSVPTLFFELIKDFGFTDAHITQILQNETDRVGALYHSESHKLLIDRTHYIIAPHNKENTERNHFIIPKTCTFLHDFRFFLCFNYSNELPKLFSNDPNLAFFDADKLEFPLVLRRWQEGDRFQPLGMKGKTQLLSDFFRLKKLSQFQKEQIWVLETAKKEICWLVGLRIDERFKITEESKSCLTLQFGLYI